MSKKTCTVLGIICLIICIAVGILTIEMFTYFAAPTLNNTVVLDFVVDSIEKENFLYIIHIKQYDGDLIVPGFDTFVDIQMMDSLRQTDTISARIRESNMSSLRKGNNVEVFEIIYNEQTIVSFENYCKTYNSSTNETTVFCVIITVGFFVATVVFFCLGYGKFLKKKREKNKN